MKLHLLRNVRLMFVFALALAVPTAASAEDDELSGTYEEGGTGEEGEDSVTYKRETVLDFEDFLLEGEVRKPTGQTLTDRAERKFSVLINERKNFEPEMVESVDQLR